MTKDNENDKKQCGSKKRAMLVYGFIQLGTGIISALSLAAIAISFCSVKKEAKFFSECVEEVRQNGQSSSAAVRFCNGG
tara:strand:- start:650 stop:886 length:237 start_codon:yes stop_codon:yes gene_type:complete